MSQTLIHDPSSGDPLVKDLHSGVSKFNFPWRWLFIGMAILLLFGFVAQKSDKMKALESELAAEKAKPDLNSKVLELERRLTQKTAELASVQASFKAEIARKSELAVLYEREKAARGQAVRDHAAALAEISRLKHVQQGKTKKK